MYIKVRTVDCKQETILTVSKCLTIAELKGIIKKEFSVEEDLQQLYFRGKQLDNQYTLYNYNVNLNDVIQLMIKRNINKSPKKSPLKIHNDKENIKNQIKEKECNDNPTTTESLYYKVGDLVDCRDNANGAWYEAVIAKIFKEGEKVTYTLHWQFVEEENEFNVTEDVIRPRARRKLTYDDLEPGRKVMINYNIEEPSKIGFWYDFTLSKIQQNAQGLIISGQLHLDSNFLTVKNHKIKLGGDIFAIEERKLLENRELDDESGVLNERRSVAPLCDTCLDNPRRKCKDCGCKICSGKDNPNEILLCDECNSAYHLRCLDPPLTSIPEDDDWYCPECKNDDTEIVKPGEKLKGTKKKSKTQNTEIKKTKEWGKGMACVGRTTVCTLVPSNHIGPIPGIEVGTTWLYRLQVSEAGVHRPHVAGIHGRETQCAFSIVLSGGYEDDIDNGEEFMYTGSGGRDLTGNKRTAQQSSDQTLTKMNKALALNCNAPFNQKTGASSEDWKAGTPVRVVRSYKLAKHSKYAPTAGNRYDGTYKVVKYFKVEGKSGFHVWRYLLRRDDPVPAPWTPEGKKRIASLGLNKIIYPEGYLEAQGKRDPDEKLVVSAKDKSLTPTKIISPPKKRRRLEVFELEKEVADLIAADETNAKLWAECREYLEKGQLAFLQTVSEKFLCVCCQEVVYKPVTTPCAHNICLGCMKRSFAAGTKSCPTCRHQLSSLGELINNESLGKALLLLYPGYGAGR